MNDQDILKIKRNLTALVEFSRILNSSMDLDFILNNILLTCMGKFHAPKAFMAINVDGSLKIKTYKGFSESAIANFPILNSGETDENIKQAVSSLEGSGGLCVFERLSSSRGNLGILCLSEKLNKNPYTEEDIDFLKTILNISSTAIQNSLILTELTKVNRELDSKLHRLNSLFDLSKEFGLLSESSKVSKILVYSVIGQFLVQKFAVVNLEDGVLKVLQSKYGKDDILNALRKYDIKHITDSFTKEVIQKEYPELYRLEVELIVPMQLQGETLGLILLGKRINKLPYTPADIEFIYSVGSLAIISLENRRLFKEALEKQKMEEELEIARDIQENLLPQTIPVYDSFELAASSISSKQVGGDYYDIIPLNETSFCLAIADVSGKGVPAALLMANLQAFLQIICKHGMELDAATGLINDLITKNTMDGKFITFFWGVLDSINKTITYCNAGHNPPLLIRDNKICKLEKGGIILGVMKTFTPYEYETVQLMENDVIVLFTDGVSEARSIDDDEFSDERLESLAVQLADKPASEILSSIQKEVQSFAFGTIQSDDITLVVLKVK